MTPIGTRSTCGNQVRSTMASNPAYSMGTSTRDSVAKRFISDEHKRRTMTEQDDARAWTVQVKPVTSTKQPTARSLSRTTPPQPASQGQRGGQCLDPRVRRPSWRMTACVISIFLRLRIDEGARGASFFFCCV